MMRKRPDRYRSIFERSAVSLWEEDISELRKMLRAWRDSGVQDVRAHLESNPSLLRQAIRSIRVVDVNDTTLRLYEAGTKKDLLGPLDITLDRDAMSNVKELIVAVAEGRREIETDSSAVTLGGKKLDLLVKVYIPAEEDEYPYALVNVIDIGERKLLERRIEDQRSLLLTLINNIPDLVFYKDRESRFIMVNRAFADLTASKRPQDVIGMTDLDLFPAGIAEKFRADDRVVMESNRPSPDLEEIISSADGSTRWMLTKKVPISEPSGEVIGLVGIARDITERRGMEEALLSAKEYAEKLIQTANIIVIGLDTGLAVTSFNDMAEKITGYTRSELEGRFPFEVLTPRDRYPEVWSRMKDLMQGGLPEIFEAPLLTKGGDERHIVWHNGELRRDGKVTGSIGFGLDITERRHMEERNLRLATLVESSHDAIVGVDPDGIVTTWNKGAESTYGYSAEEMIGRPIGVVIPPDLAAQARTNRERVERGEDIGPIETEQIRKDGRKIFVSLTLSPIRDAENTVVGTASISIDITARKALQAQLIRSQRLESLGTLAAGIAHQFNNINMAVRGYLDLIAQSPGLLASTAAYLKEALRGVQRSIEITERLQGLTSAAPAGRETLRLEKLVPTLLPLFERQLEGSGVTIQLDLQETQPVLASRSMLGFVITSLLTNSVHALLDCPSRIIVLRTRSQGDSSSVEVSDTGCGIPHENLPRIFSPFFTTKGEWAQPGSAQARVRGIGLSLAVSQSTVSELGGRIEVESAPGQGSTFRVWLPSAGASSAAAGTPRAGG